MSSSKLSIRRTSISLAAAALVFAACGGDDDTGSAGDTTAVSDAAASGDTTAEGAASTTPATTAPAADAGSENDTGGTAGKPEVVIPAEPPTELVVTELIPGSGPVAEVGDTVTVNYVGVRSADGV